MSFLSSLTNFANPFSQVASAVQSVVNPIVSSVQSHKNRDAQREANFFNLQENQTNRDFNAQQAQLDRDFNAQQAQLQNEFNAKQSQIAFDRQARYNQEQWERENEYNSPKAQVQRLIEAGINPNSFGGDNMAGSMLPITSPSASGTSASHGSIGASSSLPVAPVNYTNPLLESAQIGNLQAQTRKLDSETDLNKANKQRLLDLLTGEKAIQHLEIDQRQFNLDKLSPAQVNNLQAQTSQFLATADKCDAERQKLYQEIDNLKQQWNLTDEQIKRAKIENQFLPDILQSEIQKNLAEAGMHEAHAYLLSKQATNVILEGGNIALALHANAELTPDAITIQQSENEYTMFKQGLINRHKHAYFFLEQGKEIIGGISRALANTAGRIGAAIASSPK